jgi:hypothetical protein
MDFETSNVYSLSIYKLTIYFILIECLSFASYVQSNIRDTDFF